VTAFLLGEARYDDRAFASAQDSGRTRDRWSDYGYRQVRYAIFWAHHEGNVFRAIHRWSEALKEDRQLYAYIRTIFSPAYRIGEFWAGHLWGGMLDPEAGDGTIRPSCLPVLVPETVADPEMLRAAIALVWEYSLWQAKKDTVTRTGAVKGDVAMVVHDDGYSVSVRCVDPGTVADVRRDSRGNVKEYVLQEWRSDPEADRLGPFGRRLVRYTEWCRRVGSSVAYTTYRDGEEYDWRDYREGTLEADLLVGPSWIEPYDFVPMVFVQHRDMGLGFGWSELQPDFGKLYELDDLASKLSDQIRKTVDCKWAVAGATPDDLDVDLTEGDGEGDDGAGREKEATIWLPEGATVTPMVAPLDIPGVASHIKSILDDIEKDHPELATDNVGLASSGEARRVAREKVQANVVQRRAPYDDALVRICQMAISIGAIKEYEGYEGYDAGSYDRGELDFAIGDRPVFAVDRSEQLAEAKATIDLIKVGRDAGLPDEVTLEIAGWAPDKIEDVAALMAKKTAADEAKAAEKQRLMMEQMGQPDEPVGPDGLPIEDPAETIPDTIQ
jgi:hypothetical protein